MTKFWALNLENNTEVSEDDISRLCLDLSLYWVMATTHIQLQRLIIINNCVWPGNCSLCSNFAKKTKQKTQGFLEETNYK